MYGDGASDFKGITAAKSNVRHVLYHHLLDFCVLASSLARKVTKK